MPHMIALQCASVAVGLTIAVLTDPSGGVALVRAEPPMGGAPVLVETTAAPGGDRARSVAEAVEQATSANRLAQANVSGDGAAENDEMRALTDGVISSLEALARAEDSEAVGGLPTGDLDAGDAGAEDVRQRLATLVREAQGRGESLDYVQQLIDEAANRSDGQVPRALVGSDGRLDTAALLDSIRAAESRAAADPYVAAIEAEGASTVVAGATGDSGRAGRYVTVQPGDTLGAIAKEIYGDALSYRRIYRANVDVLTSPDTLIVGQRLFIPD